MTQEFIDRAAVAAADLALLFVGVPDQEMLHSLAQVRSNVAAGLAECFAPKIASLIAEAFVAAVVGHRREIEAAGTTARVVN
jgi:hypothetical protein